jgi:crotonobetainyl-CoA:carnitine CoA-transferase CaiB-like acyl-CoA transferase
VPAIVERVDVADPWLALAEAAAAGPASDLAARAHLLGVPAAVLGESVGLEPLRSVVGFRPMATKTNGRTKAETMVVDLSAMWAGPLCARLLGLGGSRVVKVESEDRPDGARRGDPGFYEWLHGGHESVVLDFGSVGGRAELQELLAAADVVLESSRPRALRNLGITADDLVARGATWVSITGYGRTEAGAGRVAFGDDAAVAGGLVAWDDAGEPLFAGDAIADPLTGLYAAVAASAAMCTGGGRLLDVAMAGVAAHVAAPVG